MSDPPPTRVFESVSADFFSYAGKSFLVCADRLSGWPIVASCGREPTARTLVRDLREVFAAMGVPNILRTDGGPQFTARYTREFLKRWGVEHRVSSPHHPASNGHAEAKVKLVKRLVQKCADGGSMDNDKFAQGLLEIRNTPAADGRSPAEVLYGQPLRTSIPMHYTAFSRKWRHLAKECDERAHAQRATARERYDRTARPLPALKIGRHVCLQDPQTRLWDKTGVIVAVGRQRTYLVKLPSGRILWRNRRFLRPYRPLTPVGGPQQQPPMTHSSLKGPTSPHPPHQSPKRVTFAVAGVEDQVEDTASQDAAPRRSYRRRAPPDQLQVDPRQKSYL